MGYAAAVGAGLIIVFLVCWPRGLFLEFDAVERYRILSDGFWIAAVAVGGVGILSAVASTGFFDLMGYAAGSLFAVLWRNVNKGRRAKDLYEYKLSREGKRRPAWGLAAVGLGFFAAAVVFMLLHNL